MSVLVCFASRHGATAGIADRIAETIEAAGHDVECVPVDRVDGIEDYDAIVVGAAAYMFRWLKDATRFVRRHRAVLADRPVWLFSSGPLGTELVDEDGRDVFEVTRPKEFDRLEAMIGPVDTHIFFGAWDPAAPAVGVGERVLRLLPGARGAVPAGDFRDWPAIEAWAESIAASLAELSDSNR
ncbi:MAG: flavodoxin domain-containing protein [Actinomycetota bacterium]